MNRPLPGHRPADRPRRTYGIMQKSKACACACACALVRHHRFLLRLSSRLPCRPRRPRRLDSVASVSFIFPFRRMPNSAIQLTHSALTVSRILWLRKHPVFGPETAHLSDLRFPKSLIDTVNCPNGFLRDFSIDDPNISYLVHLQDGQTTKPVRLQ